MDPANALIEQLDFPEENTLLGSLHTPLPYGQFDDAGTLVWDRNARECLIEGHNLPIPPPHLRMSYGHTQEQYLEMGRLTAGRIRQAAENYGLSLSAGRSILDWGCASGRVLRNFAGIARHSNFWGCDRDAPHISWARANLSPPFHFTTCNGYPHLPFEDNTFDLIYSISIFTHMYQLLDQWLMELRRILAPGGHLLCTVHDEHTWKWLKDRASQMEALGPWRDWPQVFETPEVMDHDMYVFRRRDSQSLWFEVQTFFRTDWLREEWGKTLEVKAVEPYFEVYQTMLLLQKPA